MAIDSESAFLSPLPPSLFVDHCSSAAAVVGVPVLALGGSGARVIGMRVIGMRVVGARVVGTRVVGTRAAVGERVDDPPTQHMS